MRPSGRTGCPKSLVVLGGGPVGVELTQFFHRLGASATIVEKHDRSTSRGSTARRESSSASGSKTRESTSAWRSRPSGWKPSDAGARVCSSRGRPIDAERLLVAVGRRPNIEGLGFEQLEVELTTTGITVDDRMRAGDGVWAIGDSSGVALLTHVGKYQARVAASNIAGATTRRRLPRDPARCSPTRRSRPSARRKATSS